MAQVTNGTVKSNTMWYSTFYCSWKRSSYSVENNQSKVDWEAGLITTNGVYWGSNAVKIKSLKINETAVLSNKTYSNISGNGTHKLASGSVTIDHNSDGTKSFDISISGWLYDTGSPTGSGTFELVPIPRASKIIAQDIDIGKVMHIQIERPVDTFTHTISFEFGNLSGEIATNIETETYWITPASLYGQVKESNSGKGRLICNTYNEGVHIGTSDAEFTAYVTNANPVINTFTYEDTNDATYSITQDRKRIIRDNSDLVFTIGNATAQKSAEIRKYELTFNGNTRTLTSAGAVDFGTVNLASNSKATLKVTDSRGNTATKELEVIIDDWKLPTGVITLGRKNNFYSETLIKVDGSYSSLNGKNTMAIQYTCRKADDKMDSVTGNLEDNVQSSIELDNNYEWHITVFVSDRIGQTKYNLYIDRGMPIAYFDRKNQNMGINCFPDSTNKLEIDGKLKITNLEATGDATAKNLPIATGLNNITSFDDVATGGQLFKSGMYSVYVDNIWYNLINVRHRNGLTDGTLYGLQIRNRFTLGYPLEWRKQNNGTWTEWEAIEEDTGWANLSYASGFTSGNAGQLKYRVKNGIVYITGGASGTFTQGTYTTVNSGLIPEKYRPIQNMRVGACGSGARPCIAEVTTDGSIRLSTMGISGTPSWISFTISYPLS